MTPTFVYSCVINDNILSSTLPLLRE